MSLPTGTTGGHAGVGPAAGWWSQLRIPNGHEIHAPDVEYVYDSESGGGAFPDWMRLAMVARREWKGRWRKETVILLHLRLDWPPTRLCLSVLNPPSNAPTRGAFGGGGCLEQLYGTIALCASSRSRTNCSSSLVTLLLTMSQSLVMTCCISCSRLSRSLRDYGSSPGQWRG